MLLSEAFEKVLLEKFRFNKTNKKIEKKVEVEKSIV